MNKFVITLISAFIVFTFCAASFLYYWKAWDRSLFLNPIYKLNTHEKIVALTFDDGPSSVRTSPLLDLLDKYNVKATFFMIGKGIEQHPEIARDVVNRGHMVGNHSYSHKRMILKSPTFVKDEIVKTEKLLQEIGSQDYTYFRPPNTKKFIILPYLLKSMNMKLVTGSFDPNLQYSEPFDWQGVSQQAIDGVSPGEIIYLHDGKDLSGEEFVKAVERIIVELRARGYKFVTLK